MYPLVCDVHLVSNSFFVCLIGLPFWGCVRFLFFLCFGLCVCELVMVELSVCVLDVFCCCCCFFVCVCCCCVVGVLVHDLILLETK